MSDLTARARAAGLRSVSARPSLPAYVRDVWGARAFIGVYARSRVDETAGRNRLGNLWLVLTPLLNGLAYYLVFGLLLNTGRGVENFIGFLVVGVFLYQFTAKTIAEGSRAIVSNKRLVQALSFPRAILPLSAAVKHTIEQGPALAAMFALVLLVPPAEDLTWRVLLLVPVFALQVLFNTGMALLLSRLVAGLPDLQNVIQFSLRLLLYASGVFYDITTRDLPPVVLTIFTLNPVYAFLTLARDALLYGTASPPGIWVSAVAWSLGVLVVGFLLFWQAEESYGRE